MNRLQVITRQCSTCVAKKGKPFVAPTAKKAVIISTSRDIFKNLALEHWFYRNFKFDQNHMLMLWVNEPCVVIGRHQNPWTECNVPWLLKNNIVLARRNSGGGTVYHDKGNLNLTFFTPNEHYHRRTNLEFISDAMYKDYKLRMEVNKREDLAIRDYKVSGTAAKLARHCAYHHCTLLINADKTRLHSALLPSDWNINSKATKSVKSKILNISEECPLNVESVTQSIARRYLEWNNTNLYKANTAKNLNRLQSLETEHVTVISQESLRAQLVTPAEIHFPGFNEIYDEYKSWQWIFGKTPKFTATKMFKTSGSKQSGSGHEKKVFFTASRQYAFELCIHVENGIITEVDVKVPSEYHNGKILQRLQKVQAVVGEKYDVDLVIHIENVFKDISHEGIVDSVVN